MGLKCMTDNVEKIISDDQCIAILVKSEFVSSGIEFFTPDTFSQQLGYMSRKAGHIIEPHFHNKVERTVHYSNEVLFIKSGKLKVHFYTIEKEAICARVLKTGDVLLLNGGAHSFEILEDCEIFEVKQGPFVVEKDKTNSVFSCGLSCNFNQTFNLFCRGS